MAASLLERLKLTPQPGVRIVRIDTKRQPGLSPNLSNLADMYARYSFLTRLGYEDVKLAFKNFSSRSGNSGTYFEGIITERKGDVLSDTACDIYFY